ncbi:hypothetical protein C5O00_13590 [Pukyongia salina]|uniref:7TM-DISM receptor extracellular domain-containing protein n=1 Tax=Pukyongia salina TaxID=2094025 RepID=A0A2S0HZP6_9FLAO|nr:7TM diverse intracellular signaling domain-containing protein [Pukyongia salina]AVI52132.1 hypothetical protein C5O00_13590 [Pukyongia salina]
MRLQLLPLALCLLVAFLVLPLSEASAMKYSANSPATIAITVIKTKTKNSEKNKKLSTVELNSATNSKAKSSTKKDLAMATTNRPNVLNEEFSYKNIVDVRSNPSEYSKNSEESTVKEESFQYASFGEGMFYGFALMVILLNLVCYFLFDEKLFLFYALTLFAVGNLLFLSDGLMPLLGFTEIANPAGVEALLVLASCFFGSWFASKYLNVDEIVPKLKWIAIAFFGSGAILTTMSLLAGVSSFAAASNLIAYGTLSLYFLCGVYMFSKKNYPKFYVIALSIPLLFAIDYFVLRNLGLEFLMTRPSHIKAAVIAEMLMLTYAIVYRMKAIKEENELRQTELRIFLKRQEVMNRKNAMQLMEEVYLENLIMHYDLDGFEIKLLQYISEGKDNAKIARKLKTTEHEIEALTKELYHKLEISEHIQEDYRMVDAQADYIYN